MREHDELPKLGGESHQLVSLVNKVLVDPNLHTDQRLRLAREITEALRAAHEAVYGREGSEVHQRALEAHGDHVPTLLEAVLVDPNLHTDARMRLHRQISAILADGFTAAGAHELRSVP